MSSSPRCSRKNHPSSILSNAYTTIAILSSLLSPTTPTTPKIQRFALHPTSQLITPDPSRRTQITHEILQNPKSNHGVYASLEPFLEQHTPIQQRDRILAEWDEYRTLSRHEREYRERRRRLLDGVDVPPFMGVRGSDRGLHPGHEGEEFENDDAFVAPIFDDDLSDYSLEEYTGPNVFPPAPETVVPETIPEYDDGDDEIAYPPENAEENPIDDQDSTFGVPEVYTHPWDEKDMIAQPEEPEDDDDSDLDDLEQKMIDLRSSLDIIKAMLKKPENLSEAAEKSEAIDHAEAETWAFIGEAVTKAEESKDGSALNALEQVIYAVEEVDQDDDMAELMKENIVKEVVEGVIDVEYAHEFDEDYEAVLDKVEEVLDIAEEYEEAAVTEIESEKYKDMRGIDDKVGIDEEEWVGEKMSEEIIDGDFDDVDNKVFDIVEDVVTEVEEFNEVDAMDKLEDLMDVIGSINNDDERTDTIKEDVVKEVYDGLIQIEDKVLDEFYDDNLVSEESAEILNKADEVLDKIHQYDVQEIMKGSNITEADEADELMLEMMEFDDFSPENEAIMDEIEELIEDGYTGKYDDYQQYHETSNEPTDTAAIDNTEAFDDTEGTDEQEVKITTTSITDIDSKTEEWEEYQEEKVKEEEVELDEDDDISIPNITDPNQPITSKELVEGGLMNNYQITKLFQGYGTHYASVWVGTPPQRKSVIVDTGSHYTAFPCIGCANCGEENHTDKYFDPSKSSTFRILTCNECFGSKCSGEKCIFSQSYTEGSSWQAYQVRDMFFVSGNLPQSSHDPENNKYAIPFMFGCQTSETGLFVTQLADGIMGMSSHEATLPKQMYNQNKIDHNMFTMCFRRELEVSKTGVNAGIMTMGGIDSRLHATPMVYAKNMVKSGWYTVHVNNIFLREGGGNSAFPMSPDQKIIRLPFVTSEVNNGKGVIVDSGTTDTYLSKSLAKSFGEAWKTVTGNTYSNSAIHLTPGQLASLPTVLIQMTAYNEVDQNLGDPNNIPGLTGSLDPRRAMDVILAIPAIHFMEYSSSKDLYTSRLYFTESRGGVLGANAMMGHDILFDWENGRVGFAESSCNYDELGEDLDQNSDKYGSDGEPAVDCKLSPPSIFTQCRNSIPNAQQLCEGNAPDFTLIGKMKWVWVIDNNKSENGMSCDEAASLSAKERQFVGDGSQATVDCTPEGLCYVENPCHISCGDLGTQELKPVDPAAGQGDSHAAVSATPCGDNSWGACTSFCTQSKMTSVLMDDGNCHQQDGIVETRTCHIEDCGRDDPCRVPFVVHAVFGLRGADPELWSPRAEEAFIDALVKGTGAQLGFVQGDINVLMASRWKTVEEGGGTPEPGESSGLKIIVEMSIFNPTAILPEAELQEGLTQKNSTGLNAILEKLEKLNIIHKKKSLPKASCKEDDLYPYAKLALNVHTVLQKEKFIIELTDRLNGMISTNQPTPFSYVNSPENVRLSKVLASWTIKTEVGVEGSIHNHDDDESMLKKKFSLGMLKEYATNVPLIASSFAGLLFLLAIGAYFGYKCEERSTLREIRMGRKHASSLMSKLKARAKKSSSGKYQPVSTQNGFEMA